MGLWIDHRNAVIVAVSGKGEKTSVIESKAEKQPGRIAGVRSTTPYESQKVSADDRPSDFSQSPSVQSKNG